MATISLRMKLRPETLAISRFDPGAALPAWATAGSLWNVTRTGAELSIVCADADTPADLQRAERPWRAFEFEGPIPFGLTGILAAALTPLAAAKVGIFAFSTFDTDFVLVKSEDLDRAQAALREAGHVIL